MSSSPPAACPMRGCPTSRASTDFKGEVYHTGHWPHEPVDFTGQRVGVIGTGSSAIQSIPVIAEQASHLTVFQRTANFSIPARNAPLTPEERESFRSRLSGDPARRARGDRATASSRNCPIAARSTMATTSAAPNTRRAGPGGGLTFMARLQQSRARQGGQRHRRRFRPRQDRRDRQGSRDRKAAAAQRSSDRLQAHLRRYRLLRDLQPPERDAGRHQIRRRSRRSLPNAVRAGGKDYEVDALVLATGFDAMTGSVAKIDIRGRDGQTLNQKWAEGPRTYLGLMSAGFPNLFMITGPGSPSVLSQHDRLDRAACRLDRRLPRLHARPRPRRHRSRPRRRGRLGRARQRGRRRARSIRRPIPGTWAPTSPASRGSSCPISAASAPTGRSATTSRPRAMRGLR